jgi:hypothetical protein
MSFSASISMPEFKSVAEYLQSKAKIEANSDNLFKIVNESDESGSEPDTFEYELTIPETVAKINIDKDAIINGIEELIGRKLSEKEAKKAWKEIKHTSGWYGIFPNFAAKCGVHVYGESDEQWYEDCFKPDVEKAIQDAVDEIFSNLWHGGGLEYIFDNIVDEINKNEVKDEKLVEVKEEEITWENVESQSQKRIQDENVKNGLARCANEKKDKSISKWREHYIKTNVNVPDSIIPKGKTKEDMIKNIISYLTN